MERHGRARGWSLGGAAWILGATVALGGCGSGSRLPPEVSPTASARPAPSGMKALAPAPTVAGPKGPEVPRSVSLDGFAEGDRIADLAGLAAGDRIVLAWVTYFDRGPGIPRSKRSARTSKGAPAKDAPAKDAPKAAQAQGPSSKPDPGKIGANVVVRVLDKEAEALADPKTISVKGVSLGGVALAESVASRGEVSLAWVGVDEGIGQVFITRLSEIGDRQAQRMVTHSKTGCSDVGLAAVADGFVVAWVESRDEKTELLVMKVGKDLAPIGAAHRIVETRGEASDVRLLRRGDEVLIFWNEGRADGDGGVGSARFLSTDLTLRGDAMLVLRAPNHARGLDVARSGDGLEAAWIEDTTTADPGAPTKVLSLAHLDALARAPGGRAVVSLPAEPSAVALACDRTCRVVVPVAEGGDLAMYGFSYSSATDPRVPRRLLSVTGVSTEDTSPLLVGDWLFFAEDDLGGNGRVRKAKLVW